jgi:hypothetical protein
MILVALVIGLVVLGLLAASALVRLRAGGHTKGFYQSLFVLSICILPMGFVLGLTVSPAFISLAGMGAIYLVIALLHRDELKDYCPLG